MIYYINCQSCLFLTDVSAAPVLENAILAFGNGSDVKTSASQPGMSSPATDNQSPNLATTAPGISMETEQNILRAQIPTQVRRDGRLKMWCTTFSKQGSTNIDSFTQNWVIWLKIGVFALLLFHYWDCIRQKWKGSELKSCQSRMGDRCVTVPVSQDKK